MKANRFLFLFLPMIVTHVAAVRQQQPPVVIPLVSPFQMPTQQANVPPLGEYMYEDLLGKGQQDLFTVAQRAHDFLFGDKDTLKCFIFQEDCLDRDRNALEIIYQFLSSVPVAPLLTRQNWRQRITTLGEALREYYEIPHQFAALSNTMQNLLLQGYGESNWMDRRLKRSVNKILGGYDAVIKNDRLMKYLTHFYFASPPTEERTENIKKILNPNLSPRLSGFQEFIAPLWAIPRWVGRQIKGIIQWPFGQPTEGEGITAVEEVETSQ